MSLVRLIVCNSRDPDNLSHSLQPSQRCRLTGHALQNFKGMLPTAQIKISVGVDEFETTVAAASSSPSWDEGAMMQVWSECHIASPFLKSKLVFLLHLFASFYVIPFT